MPSLPTIIAVAAGIAGVFLVLQDSGLFAKVKNLLPTFSKESDFHSYDHMLDKYLNCEADRTPEKDAKVKEGLHVLIEHCIKHDAEERHPGLSW